MAPPLNASVLIATTALALIAPAPLSASPVTNWTRIRADAVAAMSAVFGASSLRSMPLSTLSSATVSVMKHGASIDVHIFNQSATLAERTMVAPTAAIESPVTLSGAQAKAIRSAYRAWQLRTLPVPDSQQDFAQGAFTVYESAAFDSKTSTPGYLISYVPDHQPAVQSGIPCPDFRNYVVVPSNGATWRVLIEPIIC